MTMKKAVALIVSVMLVFCMLSSSFAATIYGSWMVKRYLDDSQNETSNKYICPVNIISGTFSNAAATNGQAYLDIVVDLYGTFFVLYENGSSASNKVKNDGSTPKVYIVQIKGDGTVRTFIGQTHDTFQDRIYLTSDVDFVDALLNCSSVNVYFENTETKYQFTGIVTDGFSAAMDDLVSPEVNSGLNCDADGVWRYYENGAFVEKTGIVEFQGGQFFVANGVLCSTANGLAEYGGQWYFLANGQIQTQYVGLALYDGEWFYVQNGRFDPNLSGLVDYDGSKFIVAAGRIIRGINGLWQNTDGVWYFLADSQVVTYYSGMAEYNGSWFYVINGRLATEFTGDVEQNGMIYHVVGGQVN